MHTDIVEQRLAPEQRVAGTGSLGVARYLLLIEGKGSPDRNRLLDLKQARPSALGPYLQPGWVQPAWPSQAERVVTAQRLVGATPVALLEALPSGDTSYRLRELRPTEDGLSLDRWANRIGRLHQVMGALGKATAWDQLRGSGRQGAAPADELRTFVGTAHEAGWRGAVLDYARAYSRRVADDWREFWAHGPTA